MASALSPHSKSASSIIDPISGLALLASERARAELVAGPVCRTGCNEIDNFVLLGGFRRGSVVGISAEEETTGLVVRLLSFRPVSRYCCD
jgi:hypothetical protein